MRSAPNPSGAGNASSSATMNGELDIAFCNESCAATSEIFCGSTVSGRGNVDEADMRVESERVRECGVDEVGHTS